HHRADGVSDRIQRRTIAGVQDRRRRRPLYQEAGPRLSLSILHRVAPQAVDEGGDIAALKGTQVRVRVTTTVPARGGRLIVERGEQNDTVALTPNTDGTLGGTLRVAAAGFYKVELEAQDGRVFPGSLDYTIDALPDRPP